MRRGYVLNVKLIFVLLFNRRMAVAAIIKKKGKKNLDKWTLTLLSFLKSWWGLDWHCDDLVLPDFPLYSLPHAVLFFTRVHWHLKEVLQDALLLLEASVAGYDENKVTESQQDWCSCWSHVLYMHNKKCNLLLDPCTVKPRNVIREQ